jgi:hypothetical protein
VQLHSSCRSNPGADRLGFELLRDLFRVLGEVNVLIHPSDPIQRDQMMLAVGAILFRQFDGIALDTVYHSHTFSTRSDDLHVFADIRGNCPSTAATLCFIFVLGRLVGLAQVALCHDSHLNDRVIASWFRPQEALLNM